MKYHTSAKQKLRSGLILNAANREAVCSVELAHYCTAEAEVEETSIGAANRTGPTAAEGIDTAEATIVTAVSPPSQFKRRSKSTGAIKLRPTQAF